MKRLKINEKEAGVGPFFVKKEIDCSMAIVDRPAATQAMVFCAG